jgi:hypothetical protein
MLPVLQRTEWYFSTTLRVHPHRCHFMVVV